MSEFEPAHQWRFLAQHLHSTPTIAVDKRTFHNELIERNQGIEYLFRVGLQLKLPIPVLATASVYFHRFFMRHSLAGHYAVDVAGACIFLACKIEECGRKLKDVAGVCHAKATGLPVNPDEHDPTILSTMKTITAYEELLLEALCFDLTIDHPYVYLLAASESLQAPEDLLAYSWSVINDSYRTPLCLVFPQSVIACGSYFLCLYSTATDTPLQQLVQSEESQGIFHAFHLEQQSHSDVDQVFDFIAIMLDFYRHIQPHVSEKLWKLNPFVHVQSHVQPSISFAPTSLHTYSNGNGVTDKTSTSPVHIQTNGIGDASPSTERPASSTLSSPSRDG